MDLESARLKKYILKDPEEGMALMIDRYGGQVKTICAAILSGYSREDIEDAAAQSFISLWQNIGRYSPSKGTSLRSYLYGIARKTALMKRRSDPLLRELPLEAWTEDISPSAEEIFLSELEEQELHRAVEEMEEPARTVFILRYFYFEKVGAIAEKLNIPRKKAENILHREKQKLRRILEKRGIQP